MFGEEIHEVARVTWRVAAGTRRFQRGNCRETRSQRQALLTPPRGSHLSPKTSTPLTVPIPPSSKTSSTRCSARCTQIGTTTLQNLIARSTCVTGSVATQKITLQQLSCQRSSHWYCHSQRNDSYATHQLRRHHQRKQPSRYLS